MKENISYPLMPEWSTAEIITASEFFMAVEQLHQKGIARDEFLKKYDAFLKMEPMKMTQKQLDREFLQASGYSIYQSVQFVKKSKAKIVKM